MISEFLAVNEAVLADEDGEYSDWIEIYNPGMASVSLPPSRRRRRRNELPAAPPTGSPGAPPGEGPSFAMAERAPAAGR